MFKKILVGLFLTHGLSAAQAQIDFSAIHLDIAGNYTKYGGEFQQKTTGARIQASVPVSDRVRVGLGYTHAFPLKLASTTALYPYDYVNSEETYNFKTFTLDVIYNLKDEEGEGFNAYGIAGAGYTMVSIKNEIKEAIPPGFSVNNGWNSENASGLIINFGIGASYSFGLPGVFAEARLSLPSNKVNNVYIENPIPMHIGFNVGLRLSFGDADN